MFILEKIIAFFADFALISGKTILELNTMAQAILPGLVELIINGYGDKNGGWESSIFSH